MESYLNSGLSSMNEANLNVVTSVQQGNKYGFILEIDSKIGKYYAPLKVYKNKEQCLQILRREMLK